MSVHLYAAHMLSEGVAAYDKVIMRSSPLSGSETRHCHVQIAVRGDDRALAIRGQLLLELHYLEIRRQSAERHGLHDVVRGCIKRAYLIRKLLDGPDGPLNDQVVSHPHLKPVLMMMISSL